MRKTITIFSFFLLMAASVSAQYRNYNTYFIDKMGVSVGGILPITSIEFTDSYTISDFETKLKPGFSIMLDFEDDMSDIVKWYSTIGYLQTGLKYSCRYYNGWTSVENPYPTEMDLTGSIVFHNISINSGLKIKPFDIEPVLPYIFAGLNFNIIPVTNIKYDQDIENAAGYMSDKPLGKDFGLGNLGGMIAIGAEFNELFFVELGYTYSFWQMGVDENVKFKSSFLGLKAGIYFLK